MLRITKGDAQDGAPMLCLEGQVIGPWLAEVKRCCEVVLASASRLTLDLANVSFIDREGLTLFRELIDRRVTLANCSPFVAEQLRDLCPCLPMETGRL